MMAEKLTIYQMKDMNENDLRQFIKNGAYRPDCAYCRLWKNICLLSLHKRDKQGFSAPDNSWFKGIVLIMLKTL